MLSRKKERKKKTTTQWMFENWRCLCFLSSCWKSNQFIFWFSFVWSFFFLYWCAYNEDHHLYLQFVQIGKFLRNVTLTQNWTLTRQTEKKKIKLILNLQFLCSLTPAVWMGWNGMGWRESGGSRLWNGIWGGVDAGVG